MPKAKRSSASWPAAGLRASAAWAAESSGPVPPLAEAVAMMMVRLMTQAKTAPRTASARMSR